MVDSDMTRPNKVTLDIELQDLLNMAMKKRPSGPITDVLSDHDIEGEALKKAWFRHVLLSVEKLNDTVENLRANIKEESVAYGRNLKEESANISKKIEKSELDSNAYTKRVEDKFDRFEKEFKDYKKEVIDPMNTKVITLMVKVGIFGVLSGAVGGGVIGLIAYIIKAHILSPAITGGH